MGERDMRGVITARQSWPMLASSGLVAMLLALRVGRIGARWWT
jgi:hypothetical protein